LIATVAGTTRQSINTVKRWVYWGGAERGKGEREEKGGRKVVKKRRVREPQEYGTEKTGLLRKGNQRRNKKKEE